MIITKYDYTKIKLKNKKINLPKMIRQYEYRNITDFNKLNNYKKTDKMYSYKFYDKNYRIKLCEKIILKNELTPNQLSFLATYILDSIEDNNILNKYQIKKYIKYEIPFSSKDEENWWTDEATDIQITHRNENKIKYSEKQTKLYKLSQIPYIPNKSRWVTPNTNNVFEFDGISYIINKDNKNYKCDAQNTSKMDRVFCAYINDGIEFYDMNIDKIDAQLLQ